VHSKSADVPDQAHQITDHIADVELQCGPGTLAIHVFCSKPGSTLQTMVTMIHDEGKCFPNQFQHF
jgi:hypothetical protein